MLLNKSKKNMDMSKIKLRVVFFIWAIAMLFVGRIDAQAVKVLPSTATYYEGPNKILPYYYTITIDGDTINVTIYNKNEINGPYATWVKIKQPDTHKQVSTTGGSFSNHQCSLSVSTSDLSDGIYNLQVYCGGDSASEWHFLQITNHKAALYYVGGKSESVFYDKLSKYNPDDYNGIPSYAQDMKHLDKIISIARQVTCNCTTALAKIKAIHDWIAINISYDYENYLKGTTFGSIDPENVFKTRHAVCSGYARLARIMFGAVGVPCLNIEGKTPKGAALTEGSKYNSTDTTHEWNAVYFNGKWWPIDITWDSKNSYYGASSPENVLSKPPEYRYFLILPELLGNNHCSICVSAAKDNVSSKRKNPISISKTRYSFKRSKLKKKKTVTIKVQKAKGKVTFTLDQAAKKAKIKVSSKGKVVIPKRCKKGTIVDI